jgi:hypothetical protein
MKMISRKSRNPWSSRRVPTLPLLAFGIGLEPNLTVPDVADVRSEKHLKVKVQEHLREYRQRLRDRFL